MFVDNVETTALTYKSILRILKETMCLELLVTVYLIILYCIRYQQTMSSADCLLQLLVLTLVM